VNLLVIFGANIGLLSDITHIANDQRSDASRKERRYQMRGLLVLDLSDLVLDFLQLLLLGTDDPLAPLRPFLHSSVDAGVEGRLQFVAVLDFGTQESPVEDMRFGPIISRRHMYLAEINTCHIGARCVRPHIFFIRGNRLILCSCPMDDHCLRECPGPGQHKRGVALPVGEPEHPIFQLHRGAFVLDAEVALALMGRFHVRVARLFALPPALETGKEGLHAGVGGVSVQVRRGMPAHQVAGAEPDAFMPDGTPEGDNDLTVQPAAFLREFIQLWCFADLYAAHTIGTHMFIILFVCSKNGNIFHQ